MSDDQPTDEQIEESIYPDYVGPRMRAVFPDDDFDDEVEPLQLRAEGDGPPTMFGHLAIFDKPALVDSAVEGQFVERIARGAFRKTISDSRRSIQVLYDHGKDPRFGRRPIAKITELREDNHGVYFEAEVLDTGTNRDELLPGLRARVFGSSFSFRPTKKPTVTYPTRASDYNPDQWPEITVTELAMKEFGPTPFPVYDIAPVGVRSITDEYLIAQLTADPERLRALLDRIGFALPKQEPAPATPAAEAAPQPVVQPIPRLSRQEWQQWLRSI